MSNHFDNLSNRYAYGEVFTFEGPFKSSLTRYRLLELIVRRARPLHSGVMTAARGSAYQYVRACLDLNAECTDFVLNDHFGFCESFPAFDKTARLQRRSSPLIATSKGFPAPGRHGRRMS